MSPCEPLCAGFGSTSLLRCVIGFGRCNQQRQGGVGVVELYFCRSGVLFSNPPGCGERGSSKARVEGDRLGESLSQKDTETERKGTDRGRKTE